MESNICPLCSGLIKLQESCYHCNHFLQDWGVLDNFFDRYAPYMDHNFFNLPEEEEFTPNQYCSHLLYCPNCQEGITRAIKKHPV